MTTINDFQLGRYKIMVLENMIEDESGLKVSLQPKFVQVLTKLADSYPRLVSREELIDSIWKGNYYVGERALTNAIWNLRNELKCDGENYIKTIRKSGYLLAVEPEKKQSIKSFNTSIDLKLSFFLRKFRVAGAALLLALVSYYVNDFDASYLKQYDDRTKSQFINHQISKLTSQPGREVYPVVSPDRHYLAYAWRKISDKTHLYLKDLYQPDLPPRQLTFGDYRESRPYWSQDGNSLYFIRRSSDFKHCQIVKMNIDMSQESVITNCAGSVSVSFSISADEKMLAFTGRGEPYVNSGLYFLELEKPQAKPYRFSCGDECLYIERDVAFSPDGKFIGVTRELATPNEDIFIINLKTGKEKRLTFGEADIKGITWHPDSERVVYASQRANLRQSFIVDIVDAQVKPLGVNGLSYPSFIPETNELVYHDWQVRSYISYFSDSKNESSSLFPLIQSDSSYLSPDYSEASKKLAYVSNETGYGEIWKSDADGTHRERLTNLKSDLIAPKWSHNGQSILFVGPESSNQGNCIYILDVDTLKVSKVKTNFYRHRRPSWSLDDKHLIVSASKDNKRFSLFRISLDGKTEELRPGLSAALAFEDKDHSIWYTKERFQGLWRFSLLESDMNPVQVLDEKEFMIKYNWVLTDNGIYYQHDYDGHYTIRYFNLSNQTISPLIKLPVRTLNRIGAMSYIPDNDKVLVTQSEYPQVDIKKLSHPLLD